MSRPTCRPQLKRNKCSRVGASNRRVVFTTVKTSVQEHPGQFQTIAVHCISRSNDSGTLIKTTHRSSLGCAPGCDAGGREFETPTGPTLRVFK